jgi:molybdopterin/thiamine biosynthesis adenylyltransferase/rhodanese-related sulfurtransferase
MESMLKPDEIRRYSRHLVMPEVGKEGQERLKAARVLVVGAGGLGSPAAMYLAAAGVGRLGLVEFDRVEESNLQRQVLYGQADVGRPKIEVAARRLQQVNPLIEIHSHEVKLDSSNAMGILEGYDLVVDGSDNFPTRYLINDACVLAGKPDVYGSIFRFEGHLSVFWGKQGPCYRCLFPEPPPPGLVPSCAEGGVLGVLPGVVGSLQASEALKLILQVGNALVGRLVVFDALGPSFRELRLKKDPDCPVCSAQPTVTGLIDYEAFCGAPSEPPPLEDINISVTELAKLQREGRGPQLLDVRTPREWEVARLDGAQLLPLQQLPQRWQEIDPVSEVVVYCHHGHRSARAVDFLRRAGLKRVRNLTGGIDAWSREVDPAVPLY